VVISNDAYFIRRKVGEYLENEIRLEAAKTTGSLAAVVTKVMGNSSQDEVD